MSLNLSNVYNFSKKSNQERKVFKHLNVPLLFDIKHQYVVSIMFIYENIEQKFDIREYKNYKKFEDDIDKWILENKCNLLS